MKQLGLLFLGMLIAFIVCYYSGQYDKNVAKQNTVVKWHTKVIREPAQIDTIYKYITKHKKVVFRDTLILTKVDTVYIDTIRTVRTKFSFRPKEFIMFTDCYAPTKVDSIKYSYRMRSAFIDSLKQIGMKEYPLWRKALYFASGAFFTGAIVYMVK